MFFRRLGKNICGNLRSTRVELTLREIKKLDDKWQELIENHGEYTIDWNWFIVKFFYE